MKPVKNAVRWLAFSMHLGSGVLLLAMIATVLADIVTRTVFAMTEGRVNFTFTGAIEIVSYGLLFMVLFSLPYSVARGQVIVDLFTERMDERVKRILGGIYTLGFGLLGAAMAIRFYEAVIRVTASGQTTQDLMIPLGYVYGVAAFATGVLALRGFVVGAEQIAAARSPLR